jgi:two-component system response regulator NreC
VRIAVYIIDFLPKNSVLFFRGSIGESLLIMETVISILVTSKQDDDRKLILDSLAGHADFRIVGIEKDETGTIIKSARLKPDVLIWDIQAHYMDETELAPIIRRRSPTTAIAVIRGKDEDNYVGRALKAGISGILLKDADMDKLASIVKIISSGGYYISASITNRVFGAFAFLSQFPGQAVEFSKFWFNFKSDYRCFSPTERNIITNIAKGFSDKETADYLHLSPGTIRNCMTAIKRKTNLKNRSQVVIYSLVCGLINFDQINIFKMFENYRHIFHNHLQ